MLPPPATRLVPARAAAAAAAAAAATTFSLLTWNLYFAPHQWETRMRHVLAECERLQPDILCFQEVLPPFLSLLREGGDGTTSTTSSSSSLTWLDRHDYVPSTLDPQAVAPYGVLTLAKRKHRPRFQSLDMPSRMGRRLLLTHLGGSEGDEDKRGRDISWTVGNVHLESLDSAALRMEQLRMAGVILSRKEERERNVVLCGDFNFCSERNYNEQDAPEVFENNVLPSALPRFRDLWPLTKKGTKDEKEGFTFDGTRNTLIGMPRPDPRMRYDRVLWRAPAREQQQQQQQEEEEEQESEKSPKAAAAAVDGRGWKPSEVRLVGTEPVEGGLFLSDHFGLLATFGR